MRKTLKSLLLSPTPPLFAMLWPFIALFLYLSFLGEAGYLTYRERKAELEHLGRSLDELKSEYRNLNDRFLYAPGEADRARRPDSEEIFLFKFENLPPAPSRAGDSLTSIEKSRLFFLFAAVFIELTALLLYARRRKTGPPI